MKEQSFETEQEENNVEQALNDIGHIVCNNPKPLSDTNIVQIAEERGKLDPKELKKMAINLQKTLLREGKPPAERRREIIKEFLNPEEEAKTEEEIHQADVKQSDDGDFLEKALVDIREILEKGHELTNLQIEKIAEAYDVNFTNLKSETIKLNKTLRNKNTRGEIDDKAKAKGMTEIKEAYLWEPNKLTRTFISERGFTLEEYKAMKEEWSKEKRKDILEE